MSQPHRTILIVDDTPEDRASFRRYITLAGGSEYTFHEAQTAAEGLELAAHLQPDVILLDHGLPDEDGLAFLEELTATPAGHTFAVIMLTGSGNEAVAVETMKRGAMDYLVKGPEIEQRLGLAVAGALEKIDLQRKVERQRRDLQAANRQLALALAAQQASDTQLRLAMTTAQMATWQWDLRTNQVTWSPSLEAMIGIPAGSFAGTLDAFAALVHPDDIAFVRQSLDRALGECAPYAIEFRMLRPDGSLRWAAAHGHVIRDEQGEPLRMLGIDMDITERKQAELELRRRELQFKTLVESAPDIISRFGRDLRHLYTSPAIERATGRKPETFIGKTNRELGMPAELCDLWDERLLQVLATGQPAKLEFAFESPDGPRNYEATIIPEPDGSGTFETVMVITRDITAYKQAEGRLQFLSDASRTLATSLDYQATIERAARLAIPTLADACLIELPGEQQGVPAVAFAHTDPAVEAALTNQSDRHTPLAARLPAYQSHMPAIVAPAELGAHTQPIYNHPLLRELGATSAMVVPLVMRGETIGLMWLYATRAARNYNAADLTLAEELARRVALALDNAQLYREAQDALQERDAFLSVASHELKNPLTSLLGRAQLLQRRLAQVPEGARAQADASLIIDQSRRINTLLTDLLDTSRIAGGQLTIAREPIDIGELVARVATALQAETTTHTIWWERGTQPMIVMGDSGRLEQVFHNLIGNAIKYSPAGGTITIDFAVQADRARIAIGDEGLGIPTEALPNLFKRFYRVSRETGQQISGSGIGLYVVREIVMSHGGTVRATSAEGVGSTFTVELPIYANAEAYREHSS